MNRWIKRLGFAGFAFFLVKGLIWLAIFAAVPILGSRCGGPADGSGSATHTAVVPCPL